MFSSINSHAQFGVLIGIITLKMIWQYLVMIYPEAEQLQSWVYIEKFLLLTLARELKKADIAVLFTIEKY